VFWATRFAATAIEDLSGGGVPPVATAAVATLMVAASHLITVSDGTRRPLERSAASPVGRLPTKAGRSSETIETVRRL
jgi:hypothetical protein